jgi:hypothetical protein
MNFNKNKYAVIKKALSYEMSDFLYKYFLLKRRVAKTLFDTTYIAPSATEFGVWNDGQVPNTYSHYADIAMETLLVKLLPLMEEATSLPLSPNYSFARIYKKGDILKRHVDRFSCEISTTLNLGGDPWPIYLEPSGKKNKKGIKINLKQGDLLIYRGNELEHWRDAFKGENCAQVFLHYNNLNTPKAKDNLFDKRPHLGLPGELSSNSTTTY